MEYRDEKMQFSWHQSLHIYKLCVNDIEQKQAIADNFKMQGLFWGVKKTICF